MGNIIKSLKDWEEIKEKMEETVKRYSPIVNRRMKDLYKGDKGEDLMAF